MPQPTPVAPPFSGFERSDQSGSSHPTAPPTASPLPRTLNSQLSTLNSHLPWPDLLWLLACILASATWCVLAARELSATFDEPFYLAAGLARWRTGSYGGLLSRGTMPLPVDVATLPLALWERWRGTPFDAASDIARLLPVARAAALLFWAMLLVYGWLAGRQLAGAWGGRLAVALLAAEPLLLGHAGLATTDIAVTACLLALAYHFQRGRTGAWRRRVGGPALWFGLALLAKASTLVLGPLVLLAIELDRLWGEIGDWRLEIGGAGRRSGPLRPSISNLQSPISPLSIRPFLRDLAQIAGIGLGVALLYCGCDWQPDASFVAWARSLPAGDGRAAMVWLAEHLRLSSNAGEGLAYQVSHTARGQHGTFLFGTATRGSFWCYFPAALAVKLSLSLLGLPLLLAALRRRALRNWALAAAGGLLVASLGFRLQIGVRLVLPVVALGTVGLAAAAVNAWRARATPAWQRRLLAVALPAGVLWSATAAVRVWPHGLCYTNELWGGTAAGYRQLGDSNYDWGQGLLELSRWQQEHGMPLMDVWYFGFDPRVRALPMRRMLYHALPSITPEEIVRGSAGRYVAVGTTFLYGPAFTEGHVRAARFFRSRRPVGRTMTFLIYDLTRPAAAGASLPPAAPRAASGG